MVLPPIFLIWNVCRSHRYEARHTHNDNRAKIWAFSQHCDESQHGCNFSAMGKLSDIYATTYKSCPIEMYCFATDIKPEQMQTSQSGCCFPSKVSGTGTLMVFLGPRHVGLVFLFSKQLLVFSARRCLPVCQANGWWPGLTKPHLGLHAHALTKARKLHFAALFPSSKDLFLIPGFWHCR